MEGDQTSEEEAKLVETLEAQLKSEQANRALIEGKLKWTEDEIKRIKHNTVNLVFFCASRCTIFSLSMHRDVRFLSVERPEPDVHARAAKEQRPFFQTPGSYGLRNCSTRDAELLHCGAPSTCRWLEATQDSTRRRRHKRHSSSPGFLFFNTLVRCYFPC